MKRSHRHRLILRQDKERAGYMKRFNSLINRKMLQLSAGALVMALHLKIFRLKKHILQQGYTPLVYYLLEKVVQQ